MSTINSSANNADLAVQADNLILNKCPFLGTSQTLFDSFYLIGYDQHDINNNYIKQIEDIVQKSSNRPSKETQSSAHVFLTYLPDDYPLVLNTVCNSKERIPLLSEHELIRLTFPEKPPLYYYIENPNNTQKYDPTEYNVTFILNNDDLSGKGKMTKCGFSFVFYETKDKKITSKRKSSLQNDSTKTGMGIVNEEEVTRTIKIFIPKAFCFMSEYPFFTQYSKIANKLYSICKPDYNIRIPIEIIIFNIINYIPSPIKSKITFSSYVDDKDKGDIDSEIILQQLSGYPLFDFNFAEIFSILPITTIAQIAICNILELNMLFFSKNIEVLNIIMYIIASLSFPCSDSEYQWFIVSISEEELIQNKNNVYIDRPGSAMLGINCSYSTKIKINNFSYPIIIADLDNKAIEVYYPKVTDEEEEIEKKKICAFVNYLEKIMVNKISENNDFLEKALISLTNELESKAKKVIHSNTNQNSQIVPKFLLWNQTIHMNNKALIELFYEFNLNVFQMLYEFGILQFGKTISKKKKNKPHNDYSIDFNINYSSFCPEQKTLFELLSNSNKVNCFILSFIQNSYCPKEMFKIPFMFTEEFLQIKKTNKILYQGEHSSIQEMGTSEESVGLIKETIKFPYFDLIDKFFGINNKNNKNEQSVTFKTFSSYFNSFTNKEIKDEYFSCLKDSINVSSKEITSIKVNYQYKWIELDRNILHKYMYFINNLSEQKREELFPSILIINKNKEIDQTSISAIPHLIEQSLFENKIITINDLICMDIILFFGMTIGQNYVYSLEEFGILTIFDNIRYCRRKYLCILLDLYLKMWNKTHNSHINSCLFHLAAYLEKTKIIPTNQMMEQLRLYSIIKKESNLQNNDISETVLDSIEILKATNEREKFKMYLIKNSCRDGVFKEDKCMNEVNNNSYDGDIELKCPKCNKQIKPLYYFQDTMNKIETNIYAPHKILMKIISIFRPKYRENLSLDSITKNEYKTLYEIALSLLFYLNSSSIETLMKNLEQKEALEYFIVIYLKKYYLKYNSM